MKIRMNHEGNLGYAADQVPSMSLADLRAIVEEAIEEWGEDAEVVTYQTNNGHGANFGRLYRDMDLFEAEDADDDDER